jgi:hypothetical protein
MNDNHNCTGKNLSIEGRYANYFEVGFNAYEFILDFAQFNQETGKSIPHTRIIISPERAYTFLRTLEDSFLKFQQTFKLNSINIKGKRKP